MRKRNRDIDDLMVEWQAFAAAGPRTVQQMLLPCATKKDEWIQNLFPSYTNEAYRHEQTTFLLDGQVLKDGYVVGAQYEYSDRIHEQFGRKWETAGEEARAQFGEMNTAQRWEAHLRLVYDAPNLELVHTQSTYNWSTGHPLAVFGFFKDGLPK